MKTKWKTIIIVLVVLALGIGVYASTVLSKRGVVAVQTGKVVRQDLTSLVTASGEIKPKNYINIGANAIGLLTRILVKEGDRVSKGQLVARVENIQPEAQVASQKAQVSSAEADSNAAEAGLKRPTKTCTPSRPSSTMPSPIWTTPSWTTTAPRSCSKTNSWPSRISTPRRPPTMRPWPLNEQQTRLAQARSPARADRGATGIRAAPRGAGQGRAGAVHRHAPQVRFLAPLDGVVTNLPVREGETVVPGQTIWPAATS